MDRWKGCDETDEVRERRELDFVEAECYHTEEGTTIEGPCRHGDIGYLGYAFKSQLADIDELRRKSIRHEREGERRSTGQSKAIDSLCSARDGAYLVDKAINAGTVAKQEIWVIKLPKPASGVLVEAPAR